MRPCLIALTLLITVAAAGCLQPTAPATPASTPPPARYAAGDLLQGDLGAAGFDDPNGTPAGAAIAVLEYQPALDEYAYTLVQPVPDGWAYVYPSGDFVRRFSRDRTAFESYRLERTGHVELPAIRGPPNATSPQPS